MKTQKTLWALLILVAVAGVSTGVVFYNQNRQLVKEMGNAKPVVPPAQQEAAEKPSPLVSSRFQFGPLVSPDGQWLVSEGHWEAPEDIDVGDQTHVKTIPGYVLKHWLYLSNLFGHNEKLVVPQILEYGDRSFAATAIPGRPEHQSWIPAGFSADGQTVYFVTGIDSGGGPLRTNNEQIINGGKNLEAIRIADGKPETILRANEVLNEYESSIVDVYAQKNMALVAGKNVFSVHLDGTGKKELYTVQSTQEMADAVGLFDPTGTRAAMATMGDTSSGPMAQDSNHCGQDLRIVDLSNASAKVVSTPEECWSLVGWVDNSTLRIQLYDKEMDLKL